MGKKYLETKKDSLESSVLGVWKTAIEEGEAIRDAAQMTKKETKLDEGELPPALKKAIDAKKKDKKEKDEDYDDDEDNKKKVKTETGKKVAVIDLKPKIKDQ